MLVASRTTTTNTMAISCHNVFCLIVLLIQSHRQSAKLGKTCGCRVASAAADDDAAAAAAAIIATDADDTVDVAASTDGLSLLKFNKRIRAL